MLGKNSDLPLLSESLIQVTAFIIYIFGIKGSSSCRVLPPSPSAWFEQRHWITTCS